MPRLGERIALGVVLMESGKILDATPTTKLWRHAHQDDPRVWLPAVHSPARVHRAAEYSYCGVNTRRICSKNLHSADSRSHMTGVLLSARPRPRGPAVSGLEVSGLPPTSRWRISDHSPPPLGHFAFVCSIFPIMPAPTMLRNTLTGRMDRSPFLNSVLPTGAPGVTTGHPLGSA